MFFKRTKHYISLSDWKIPIRLSGAFAVSMGSRRKLRFISKIPAPDFFKQTLVAAVFPLFTSWHTAVVAVDTMFSMPISFMAFMLK